MSIILAHDCLGAVSCCGSIEPLHRGDGTSDLICNGCGQRIQTEVPSGEVERELARLAEKCGYSVFPCAHCGVLNICTEVALVDALACPRCGTGLVNSSSATQQHGDLE